MLGWLIVGGVALAALALFAPEMFKALKTKATDAVDDVVDKTATVIDGINGDEKEEQPTSVHEAKHAWGQLVRFLSDRGVSIEDQQLMLDDVRSRISKEDLAYVKPATTEVVTNPLTLDETTIIKRGGSDD